MTNIFQSEYAGMAELSGAPMKPLGIPRGFSFVNANFNWHQIYFAHKVRFMCMPFLRRFFLQIYRHAILKIAIELQPDIKAFVLILMHINRFHQQPQIRITDVLVLY